MHLGWDIKVISWTAGGSDVRNLSESRPNLGQKYSERVFLFFHFLRGQKYPSTITNWILSDLNELEMILIQNTHPL
jgi:hypothetical protein